MSYRLSDSFLTAREQFQWHSAVRNINIHQVFGPSLPLFRLRKNPIDKTGKQSCKICANLPGFLASFVAVVTGV